MNLTEISVKLDQAAQKATPTVQMANEKGFNLEQAYQIQKQSIQLREDRNDPIVGYKMGFTSKLKMQQMGVHDMIWGRLTKTMKIADGGETPLSHYIHPRVEPEIALLIEKNIDQPINLLDAKNYVAAVAPALEIIDSRYENFKFSLEDVIADNCSSSGFVVGQWQSKNTSIQNLGMHLSIDGKSEQIGSSNAILGKSLESLSGFKSIGKL